MVDRREGIAIAGNLIVDYIKIIDGYPGRGLLSNIESISRSIGGCAANTIVDLARIDAHIPLSVLGCVGDDENGRYITRFIADQSVDISGIRQKKSAPTSFTDVMTEKADGARTFFHARGANALFGFDDIDFDSLTARHFHIGYALLLDRFDARDDRYGTVMAKALARARQLGIRTSMDVVSENSARFQEVVTPSLKHCEYLIINEIEASMISGLPVRENGVLKESLLKTVSRDLINKGVIEMIVMHAPEGACAMNRDGEFLYVPSLILPDGYIKGTVGAGDAFCAGMLYSIYQGFDIERSLKIAACAAACCLSEANSVDGMKDITEIEKMLSQFDE